MKAKAVEKDHPTTEAQVEKDLEQFEEELAREADQIEARATVSVRRMFKHSGELLTDDPEEEDADIEVLVFEVEPAQTSLRSGVTLNMGNYYSMTVQVHVSVPCYREELEGAAEFASNFVAKRLDQEIESGQERIRAIRKSKGTGKGLF